MTAYWIATYDELTDPDKVAAYAALAGPGPAPPPAGGSWPAETRSRSTSSARRPGRC